MKRVSGGNTDYCELCKDYGIFHRFHNLLSVCVFVAEHGMLPAGVTLSDFTGKRRTVFHLPNGEHKELQAEWNEHQPRIQGQAEGHG